MYSKKIYISLASVIILLFGVYFIINKNNILDFFGYYQPPANSICGKEGDLIGGNIYGCCPGLKSKPIEPIIKNGYGGLFGCSK